MISPLRVISLDRTPERFTQFLKSNPHVPVERFPAANGIALDRSECVRQGVITEDNAYRPGALGAALSHVTLWRHCAARSEPYHIAEDDVILRADFPDAAAAMLRTLVTWDIVLWTHNFDWPVMLRPPGVGPVVMQFNPEDVSLRPVAFQWAITPPILLPLVSAAGIGCYSVTPTGAAKLLAACLPIGNECATYVANLTRSWSNTGIDVEMARHYGDQHAFMAIPPLAVVPNNQTASTIRGHLASLHDPATANRAPPS
jgi:GR25 family glycosyltransferase involved in LPS biosynthesis